MRIARLPHLLTRFNNGVLKPLIYFFKKPKNVDELVETHFLYWSNPDHQCKKGFEVALGYLVHCDNPTILETGTSAYGVDSSRLFNSFVQNFGGAFYSIDINEYASRRLLIGKSKRTKYLVGDSVQVIKEVIPDFSVKSLSLVYLDSWDVDWKNPTPSATHGLNEFKAILQYLQNGSIVMVDDTPSEIGWIPQDAIKTAEQFVRHYGVLPGKGALILADTDLMSDFEIVHHSYNLVMVKK